MRRVVEDVVGAVVGAFRPVDRFEEAKPLMTCLAPQYADCSGMARSPSAEPICTMAPWSRGGIRFRQPAPIVA